MTDSVKHIFTNNTPHPVNLPHPGHTEFASHRFLLSALCVEKVPPFVLVTVLGKSEKSHSLAQHLLTKEQGKR